MHKLYLDTETASEADLRKRGAYVYLRHPSSRVLMLTYALDDQEPQIVELPRHRDELPDDFKAAFTDPGTYKVAHNAQFDRWGLQYLLGIKRPIEEWYCTMSKAFTVGLPGGLDKLCVAFGVDDDLAKLAEGKKLIRLFCMPQVPQVRKRKDETPEQLAERKSEGTFWATPESHPEQWARFCQYGLNDISAMREVDRQLPNWNYQGRELAVYHLDQRINDRGLPVDLELARKAATLCDTAQTELNAELQDITEGAIESHSKREQVMGWLREQGVPIKGYTKDDVATLLGDERLKGTARRVLEIRQQAGRTSTAKYVAFANVTSPDTGRVHGALQYYGAMRTGRWAGRMVQPQNSPRPSFKDLDLLAEAVLKDMAGVLYDDMMEVGASCVRPTTAAPAGRKLVAGDYSNIEGRVLAWFGGELWKLRAFAEYDAGEGPDLYKVAYGRAFGIDPNDVTPDQRQIGKVMELALGYQGAYGAFVSMGENMGLVIPPESTVIGWVTAWRQAHPLIVKWWYLLEDAARAAIQNPGRAYKAGKVAFKVIDKWLLCRLPSGRFLCYFNPRLTRDGKIQYEGKHPYTGKWTVLDTYGGKLSENCLAGDTQVLTNSGWRAIAEVSKAQKVWDGAAWVTHDGLLEQGRQQTITLNGVRMTPDHKVLTNRGWVCASQSSRHDRFPDGGRRSRGGAFLAPGFYEPVFDLKNCGPRSRFVVRSAKSGEPFIVHNCTQAAARDVMSWNMPLVEEADFGIVGSVHDELITEVDLQGPTAKELEVAMGHVPDWAPGLPLSVEAWEGKRYRK